MALFLTYLLHTPVRRWYVGLAAATAVLLVSKIYGYPVLNSLNLLGSAMLLGVLAWWVLQRERLLEPA
jgi:hypothetical protein